VWKYFAFADASAGRNDAFTCCISHLEGKKEDAFWTCDAIRGRSAPFEPRAVSHEFAALARSYEITTITGDAYAGEWVASAFSDAGMRYEVSPLPKSGLYLESLPIFNQGRVRIPQHDKLLYELRNLERRVSRVGKDSVDHPRSGSDDLANALCGCLYISMNALRKPRTRTGVYGMGGPVKWLDEKPERPHIRFINVDAHGNELKTPEEVYAARYRKL
jgi:hypothetical protein